MTQDLRYAIRMLIRDRWVTILAVLALGLGIGVNNTVFTCVNGVLLRGLPYEDSDRILFLTSIDLEGTRGRMRSSHPDFGDWRAEARSFSGLAAYVSASMNLSDGEHAPERVSGAWVTANTFSLVGQAPLFGRDFAAGEDEPGSEPVAIIGYNVWMNRYGGATDVLGETLRVNEATHTIVGVMPEGMQFPGNEDVWIPYSDRPGRLERNERELGVFGRLAEGVSLAEARAEMSGIASRLARTYPDTNRDIGVFVQSYNEEFNGGTIKVVFLALMGAVGFVLLIACANVANLLLARSAFRAKEIAVRAALGATRGRLLRQLMAECLLLGMVAGVAGLALSVFGVKAFAAAVENVGKPYWIQFSMDARVAAFFIFITLGAGLLFGLVPALQGSRLNVNETLQQTGRSGATGRKTRRFTRAMVAVQLALTMVLLFGAALMIRSFLNLYTLDLGIRTEGVLTARLGLAERKYPKAEDRIAFHRELAERLESSPDVASSALASRLPLAGAELRDLLLDASSGDDERPPNVSVIVASAGYFDTLGTRLRRGRDFMDRDGLPGAEAAIVNERFVTLHFPDRDPLGQRLRLRPNDEAPGPWLTIIGVAPTIRQRALQEIDPDAVVYLPYRQEPTPFVAVLARGPASPAALSETVRKAVTGIDADLPVYFVQTLDEALAQRRWAFSVFGSLFIVFAVIALLLAAVGIYGVVSYAVSQRRQEIGVRMMLGATNRDVARLIVRQSSTELLVGNVLGAVLALGAGQLLTALLVQVTPGDPLAWLSVLGLALPVSAAACFIPARRAGRLSAVNALRET